jgi:hypothetical protein
MRLVLIVASLLTLLSFAITLQDASAASQERGTSHQKGQKVLDFEDETIEGLNKRPLDSLSQLSERDKRRRKPHLYRKRVGFRSETAETLRALRYTQ